MEQPNIPIPTFGMFSLQSNGGVGGFHSAQTAVILGLHPSPWVACPVFSPTESMAVEVTDLGGGTDQADPFFIRVAIIS